MNDFEKAQKDTKRLEVLIAIAVSGGQLVCGSNDPVGDPHDWVVIGASGDTFTEYFATAREAIDAYMAKEA